MGEGVGALVAAMVGVPVGDAVAVGGGEAVGADVGCSALPVGSAVPTTFTTCEGAAVAVGFGVPVAVEAGVADGAVSAVASTKGSGSASRSFVYL